jgi:hypothetical protein
MKLNIGVAVGSVIAGGVSTCAFVIAQAMFLNETTKGSAHWI